MKHTPKDLPRKFLLEDRKTPRCYNAMLCHANTNNTASPSFSFRVCCSNDVPQHPCKLSELDSLSASIRSRENAFWTTFIKSCLGRLLSQKSNANLDSTITSTDFLMQLAMFSAGQPFLTLFCCACMTALPHCWTQNAPGPGGKV